ncbi:FlgL flagellar hook-associated proteins 3 [Janthinobacterium sp. Marseille]|nr:flagellar hook-associated protein FlgL [Janthinobacterium sp. Marseille]ABR89220.1 FlgL flagellar hook-associated proteins 3 [Janthinobacterium sp. Marseille]
MRISTNTIFEMGSGKIGDMTLAMFKTQQQIASGLRILSPADDPVAAAAALGIDQAISINNQFATNRANAKSALSEEESVLQSVTTLLQSIKTSVVGSGNASMDDSQRQAYVTQLRNNFEELLGLANTRGANGDYLFGGYQVGNKPFTESAGGAVYSGDQGQRMLQVGAARQLSSSDSGSSIFEGGMTGNGRFQTSASNANTGSGLISTGSVTDLSLLTGAKYDITFSIDAAGATTYLVTQTPPPATPATPQPYVSGQAITFDGMTFDVKGVPANGDTFSIEPSTNQSIFTTITDLLNVLSTSTTGEGGKTRLTNGLSIANNNIDNALANISKVRTTVGTRLQEIDNLDNVGSNLTLQYTDTLKQLQEIDPIEAYSRFTQQQFALDAAQKTFIKIAGLSLFNMLS